MLIAVPAETDPGKGRVAATHRSATNSPPSAMAVATKQQRTANYAAEFQV